MAFALGTTMTYIQTLLTTAPKLFTNVYVGNAPEVPGEGPNAVIKVESVRVPEVTLNTPTEVHTVKVRIYRARYTQGEQAQELASITLVGNVTDRLYGALSLGGTPRNIDVAGQYGTPLEVSWMEATEAESEYHIADITLPLIADNATEMEL